MSQLAFSRGAFRVKKIKNFRDLVHASPIKVTFPACCFDQLLAEVTLSFYVLAFRVDLLRHKSSTHWPFLVLCEVSPNNGGGRKSLETILILKCKAYLQCYIHCMNIYAY